MATKTTASKNPIKKILLIFLSVIAGLCVLCSCIGQYDTSLKATEAAVKAVEIDISTGTPALSDLPSTNTPHPTATTIPTATTAPTDTTTPTQTPTIAPTETTVPTPTATTAMPTNTPVPTSTAAPATYTSEPTQTAEPTIANTQAPGILATGNVVIVSVFYNGVAGKNEPDEYVLIKNNDTAPIQLHGWSLMDQQDHVFTFPAFEIQPGQECRVYTNETHPDTCGFSYRNSRTAIWNNSGDCAILEDSQGTRKSQSCY